MLLQNGYRCLEAANGAEALQLLDRHTDEVHLVLTDLMMPQMTGTELAGHLATLRPDVPVIFMSGYTEDPIVRTVERDASLFLPKPFTANLLLEKVQQTLKFTNSDHHSGYRAP